MSEYTLTATVGKPYDEAVAAVRAELAEVGFGVLTEIDLRATLKQKLDVDIAPQVILGACRPQLAHRALEAEPSVAALLPCNVVVRALDDRTSLVEAVDPQAMMALAASGASDPGRPVADVAADARARLVSALAALTAPAAPHLQEND